MVPNLNRVSDAGLEAFQASLNHAYDPDTRIGMTMAFLSLFEDDFEGMGLTAEDHEAVLDILEEYLNGV